MHGASPHRHLSCVTRGRLPKPPRCLCREEGLSVRRSAAQARRIFGHVGYDWATAGRTPTHADLSPIRMYTTNRQLGQAVTPTKHRQSKLHHIHLRVRCAYSHHASPKVSWSWRSSRRIMKSTSGRCRMMSARPPGVPRIRDAPQKINTFPPRYRGFLENQYGPVVIRCFCAWSTITSMPRM
jgi:hypothetical protein